MAEWSHPTTGVRLNEITVLRTKKLTEAERRTARIMIMNGEARWLVAAQLGCHPLQIDGIGPRKRERRTPYGGHLKAKDAKADQRQMSLSDLLDANDVKDNSND